MKLIKSLGEGWNSSIASLHLQPNPHKGSLIVKKFSYLKFCEWMCVRVKDNNLPNAQQFETRTSKYAQQNLQATPTQLGVYVKILNQRIVHNELFQFEEWLCFET